MVQSFVGCWSQIAWYMFGEYCCYLTTLVTGLYNMSLFW
uniref:Uncharacterized protein n=1 Tax=Arundo donax TaxID=35708 RepID=A0A0A9A1L0_ARUDO